MCVRGGVGRLGGEMLVLKEGSSAVLKYENITYLQCTRHSLYIFL